MTTSEHLKIHDRQIAQHEKQIASIRALIKGGMQMVIATREDFRAARKEMGEMRDLQRRTEKNLATLIAALGRSTNGKH